MSPLCLCMVQVKKEIIEVVHECKKKHSTDFNGLSMAILKNLIETIVTPFAYICN